MEAKCVGIFPLPLHIVALGEKSKRSGIYIYILENLVSLFVEEATEVAEEEILYGLTSRGWIGRYFGFAESGEIYGFRMYGDC